MSIPEHITKGFDFDEAIQMTDLCRRAYKIFDETDGRSDPRNLYKALYDDEWEYVHVIADYDTDGRCLIARRKNRLQFAVAFRGTVLGGGGLELTTMGADMDLKLIPYPPIPGEAITPPRDARVHQGFLRSFGGFKDELQLFFNVLVSADLSQKLLISLVASDMDETESRIHAICAALGVKYGHEVEERALQNIRLTVQQIKDGARSVADVNFNSLIEKEIKFHQILDDLTVDIDPDGEVADASKLEVFVVGHSLGGALATIAALGMKRYWDSLKSFPPFALKKYTIGSPKVGNKEFTDYYDILMKGFSYRVQNQLDPVIHEPTMAVLMATPFPYNLQLLIPGINYVRSGDDFYDNFAHVGEAYTVWGIGHQTLDLDFGGPLKFSIPLPFPHGADGYKEMLIEARESQNKLWGPAQTISQTLMRDQKDQMTNLDKQLQEIRKDLKNIQRKLDTP